MVRIQTPPTRYDTFRLEGGLDLITPTLDLKPGVARDALNFEVSATGGYSRIAGYERYDGRPSPAAAAYNVISLSSVSGLTAGATIQNSGATATGVVLLVSEQQVVYTKATGTFALSDQILVGATPIGTVTSVSDFVGDARLKAIYYSLARDNYRADIAAVPGSGPIRGVASLDGVVYAWRDNAAGTAMVIHKSSGSGWTAVALGYELGFNTGTGTAIAEGNTVSNQAGTATGVVSRVVLENGTTWAAGSGRLILSSTTGTWAASDQIRVGGTQRATATGAATATTLAPGGRVETVASNMGGSGGSTRLYGADGVNKGFEFDGTVYVPIRTGMTADTPTHVAVHQNYLFLSFGASLQNSGVGTPYVWSPIFGANEIVMPEPITALLTMPGSATNPALAVFGRNNTFVLYGIDTGLQLVAFDKGTGAAAYTAQLMTDAYTLDDRGVISMTSSQNFGNFDSSTLTYPLRTWIQPRIGLARASSVNRERSQYRLFYTNGEGLYLTIVNGRRMGAMPVQFPVSVTCWCEGEADSTTGEAGWFGADDGYVYKMDTGPDFDGQPIGAAITLNFNPQGNARVLKRYRRASIEMSGSSFVELSFGYSVGYDTTDLDQPLDTRYEADYTSAIWDQFTWDEFCWDGRSLAPIELACDGTAENIALRVSTSSKLTQPFTMNSATLHYSIRRGLR